MDGGNALSAEIEELMKELLPDHVAVEAGPQGAGNNNGNNLIRENTYRMERGVNFPPVSLYSSNQQSMAMNLEKKNYQVAATTSNINPGMWQHSQRTPESTSRVELTNSINRVNPTLLESAPRVELTSSVDWVSPAFNKLLMIKQMYLSEAFSIFSRAQEGRQRAMTTELAMRHERSRIYAEKIIRFLSMSKSDLLKWRKEKLYQNMNDVIRHLDRAKQQGQQQVQQAQQQQLQQAQQHQVLPTTNLMQQQRENHHHFAKSSSSVNLLNVGSSTLNNSSSWNNAPMRSSQQQRAPQGSVTSSSPHKGFDQSALGMMLHSNGVARQNNNLVSRNMFNPLEYNSTSAVAQSSGAVHPMQQIIPQKNKQQAMMQKSIVAQSSGAAHPMQQIIPQIYKQQQMMMQKRNEDNTKFRCYAGLHQTWSPQKSSSISISPQNSQEYSSIFAKSARPLTPLTPLTPSSAPEDSRKIPSPAPPKIQFQEKNQNQNKIVADEDSGKIPSSAPAKQEKNQNENQIVDDALMKPCLHEESNDKQSSIAKQEDPLKCLIEVVKSISSTAFKSALQDICAVTNITDKVAGQFFHGEYKKVFFHNLGDEIISNSDYMKSRMKRICATTETEFCDSGKIKRLKKEPNDLLLQEIKEINQRLIEVVVDVKDFSVTEYNKGTVVRCSYIPVGFSGNNIKSPNTSKQMFPSLILELIVTDDYPNSSPTISEPMPTGCSDGEEGRYLWMKAKSNLSLLLRKYSEAISLRDIAEAWDVCCRELFHEFAEQTGVGSVFSSRYGKWESCIVAS